MALRKSPIGTGATGTRTETDAMGPVEVPAERYWGAQTQRSLRHFAIGHDRLPLAVYHAYGHVKRAAAELNAEGGRLDPALAEAVAAAAAEVAAGELDAEFPLYVWQSGSGTHANMNVNEVVANRASQLLGGPIGPGRLVHPNDHVNLAQSSNDSFPTAMHLATLATVGEATVPSLDALADALRAKAEQWVDVVKIGRTHLQDATPLTVGQEWSGWAAQLRDARERLMLALDAIRDLAAGGTAVGTGINAPDGFGRDMAERLSELTGLELRTAPNKFAAQASLDGMVAVSAGLRGVAVALMKIANDMRWLSSGPRAGIRELRLPANEPGSSIMPGKVNPSQQEAMVMVCTQVIGEDAIVAAAGAQGHFELNTMRPIVIDNVLHSAGLLADAAARYREYSVLGAELDTDAVADYVGRSLMLVTALSPHIGYDRAAAIAHRAEQDGTTLREAAVALGVDGAEFDRIVDPAAMVGDPRRDLGI